MYSAINAAPSNQVDSPSKVTSTATSADMIITASSSGESTRSKLGCPSSAADRQTIGAMVSATCTGDCRITWIP